MPSNFWLKFAVAEALAVAQAFLSVSTLTDAQKKALNDLIAAGQEVDLSF